MEMGTLSILSTVLGVVTQVAGAKQQYEGNKAAAAAAQQAAARQAQEAAFRKAQLESNAIQATASAQRDALEEKRKARLVMSRALALAGASGAGASDPTVLNLLSDISGEGSYRAGAAIYSGQERARQLEMGADAAGFEGAVAVEGGNARAKAYDTAARSSLLTGASSLFAKYGMGGPKKSGNTQEPAPVEDRPPVPYYDLDVA